MPTYFYRAKSFSGEEKTGKIEARDEQDLAKILKKDGLFLVSSFLEKEEKRKKIGFGVIPFFKRVSLKDKLIFCRNLEVMIAAGISLPRALKTLSNQTKNRTFQRTILEISKEIKEGKNFSEAIGNYPYIFSPLFYNMVKVGEESGTLEEVLKNLALQIEREHELKSKIKSALIYPTIIILVMICVAILMLIIVVPKLAEVFKDLAMELPLSTRIVINSGVFLANNFIFIFIIFLLFLLLFYFGLKSARGRKIKDAILLKVPIIGPLIKKVNTSYAVRNLGILTNAGVSFLTSLEIIANVLPNIYFKEAFLKAQEEVKRGRKFSEALEKFSKIFPPTVIEMLAVGEETGETSKILGELADFFEEEVTVATKNLVSVIEPILMVIIGATVGFFAISMIQPIYSMLSGIK